MFGRKVLCSRAVGSFCRSLKTKLQLPANIISLDTKPVAPSASRCTLWSSRSIQFARSATISSLPLSDECCSEVAFAGRSNVGKSSLLNALTHSTLARTSKTPGRTQMANYFKFTKAMPSPYLVDLPGYGFGKAPEAAVDSWNVLIGDYIRIRHQEGVLKRVFLLLDSRRGFMPQDCDFIEFLSQHNVPFQVVLTKVDRISSDQEVQGLVQGITAAEGSLNAATWLSPVHLVSAKAQTGLQELRSCIEHALLSA